MTNAQTKQRHSLEGKDTLRVTDFTDKSSQFNQGIVDGQPVGSQPAPASVGLDTVFDPDASADDPTLQHPSASSTLTGATSKDVYHGLGMPVQGMSSQEAHHDGQPGRKRRREGVEQFGEGEIYGVHREMGTRKVDEESERRFVASKNELRGKKA